MDTWLTLAHLAPLNNDLMLPRCNETEKRNQLCKSHLLFDSARRVWTFGVSDGQTKNAVLHPKLSPASCTVRKQTTDMQKEKLQSSLRTVTLHLFLDKWAVLSPWLIHHNGSLTIQTSHNIFTLILMVFKLATQANSEKNSFEFSQQESNLWPSGY